MPFETDFVDFLEYLFASNGWDVEVHSRSSYSNGLEGRLFRFEALALAIVENFAVKVRR